MRDISSKGQIPKTEGQGSQLGVWALNDAGIFHDPKDRKQATLQHVVWLFQGHNLTNELWVPRSLWDTGAVTFQQPGPHPCLQKQGWRTEKTLRMECPGPESSQRLEIVLEDQAKHFCSKNNNCVLKERIFKPLHIKAKAA